LQIEEKDSADGIAFEENSKDKDVRTEAYTDNNRTTTYSQVIRRRLSPLSLRWSHKNILIGI
jgi:hypothetical protein